MRIKLVGAILRHIKARRLSVLVFVHLSPSPRSGPVTLELRGRRNGLKVSG